MLAIRGAMNAALHEVFIIALVFLVLAFIVHLFIKEVELRKTSSESR